MIGPRANPTPLVPAQKPMARWRSASSRKTSVMMESVDGIMSAAPMPMLARAAISTDTDPENAAHADPQAKAISPAMNVRLRPTWSARLPNTSNKPPKTRAYASTIHCSSEDVAPRSRTSVGSATLRTVLSRLTIRMEKQRTARVNQRDEFDPSPAISVVTRGWAACGA